MDAVHLALSYHDVLAVLDPLGGSALTTPRLLDCVFNFLPFLLAESLARSRLSSFCAVHHCTLRLVSLFVG